MPQNQRKFFIGMGVFQLDPHQKRAARESTKAIVN